VLPLTQLESGRIPTSLLHIGPTLLRGGNASRPGVGGRSVLQPQRNLHQD
jgi:hypothetical protein